MSEWRTIRIVELTLDVVICVGCAVASSLVLLDLFEPSTKQIAVTALVACGRVAGHIAKHTYFEGKDR